MLSPTTGTDRVLSLDVLRGSAVPGIFAMNIRALSMVIVAAVNPSAYDDAAISLISRLVYFVRRTAAKRLLLPIFM